MHPCGPKPPEHPPVFGPPRRKVIAERSFERAEAELHQFPELVDQVRFVEQILATTVTFNTYPVGKNGLRCADYEGIRVDFDVDPRDDVHMVTLAMAGRE